jgi:hypothetical protein
VKTVLADGRWDRKRLRTVPYLTNASSDRNNHRHLEPSHLKVETSGVEAPAPKGLAQNGIVLWAARAPRVR